MPGMRPMPIDSPIPQDTRSRLADWLELETLVRPRGVATRSDALRLFDFIEDDGHKLEIDEVTVHRLRIVEAAAPRRLAEAHGGASASTLNSLESWMGEVLRLAREGETSL